MKILKLTPIILIGTFFFFFLLLTPLGLFNDWIPPTTHTGFYSVDKIDPGDDSGYYTYLRSLFFDRDIDFYNERFYAYKDQFNSTGYVFNNWQIGHSFFVFPFFLLGHGGAKFLNTIGYPVALDGYSFPYLMSTALASQTYLFLGLLILFQINRKYFSEISSVLASLTIWIASPLIYYTFIRQRMAHTVEFFLAALFIWTWLNNRESSDRWKHALMGSILGILASVRIMGLGLAVIYIVDQLWLLKNSRFRKLPIKCLIYFAVAVLLFFSTQLISWQIIEGLPLPMYNVSRNLGYVVGYQFSVNTFFKNTYTFFLGHKWGILYSSPILLFGFLGLIVFKKLEETRWPIIMAMLAYSALIIYYVNDLASYQFRYLIPIYPLAGLGLAYFFNEAFKYKAWRIIFVFLVFVLILGQYFILIQYKVVFGYQDSQLVFRALSNILKVITSQYELLLRSTNFFKLITLDIDFNWTYKEFSYLLFFPLLQLFLIVIVYKLFHKLRENFKKINGEKAKIICLTGALVIFIINIFLLISSPEKTRAEIIARKDYMKFNKQATEAESNGDIDKALSLLSKMDNILPYIWRTKFRIALFLNYKGEIKKANKYYQEVLHLNPQLQTAKLNLAINFIKLENYNQAEKLIRSAIKDNRRNPRPYQSLAQLLVRKKKFKEAEFYFRRAISVDPKFELAVLNFSVLLNNLKRYEEAETYFKRLITINPKRGVANLYLAILLTNLKRYGEAINHLKIAFDKGIKNQKMGNLLKFYGIKAYTVRKGG